MKKILFACSVKKDLYRIASLVNEIRIGEAELEPIICYCGYPINYVLLNDPVIGIRIPIPDYYINLPSGLLDFQVSSLMEQFDSIIEKIKPELIIVPGYHYLALGYCLAASEKDIPICNLDAGLRPLWKENQLQDVQKPMDGLTSLFFVSEPANIEILVLNNVDPERIFFAGNPLFEALAGLTDKLNVTSVSATSSYGEFALGYFFCGWDVSGSTEKKEIRKIIKTVSDVIPLVIPMYSSWKLRLSQILRGITFKNVHFMDQMEYPDYLALIRAARFVITDSNTIQEESSFFGVPCLTLNNITDRPVTVSHGTNILTGRDIPKIINHVEMIKHHDPHHQLVNEFFYENAGSKMVSHIKEFLESNGN